MKCIRCGQDARYKDRPDRRCPGCRKPFAFEPVAGDPVTDAGFQAAIDRVSSMGTVRFLPDHVWYELARRKRSRGYGRYAFFGAGGIALVGGLATVPIVGAVIAAGFVTLGLLAGPDPRSQLDHATFRRLWERWIETHGAPKGLIVRRAAGGPYRAPVEHAELEHYSFDRAVICDRAETVDVLLANNFHFENNCAVLSVDGYPEHAFTTVRAMLRNNPRLTVYALHDATVDGCTLAHKLASDASWFRGGARVIEVGLRPAHAQKLRGVWQPANQPLPDGAPLAKHERAWLARYSLELLAVRPEQVIKRLFAAMVSTAERKPASAYVGGYDGGGGGDYYVDDHAMSEDASASDGGDDAFG